MMQHLLSIADLRRAGRDLRPPFQFSLGSLALPQAIEVQRIHRLLPGKRLTAKAQWCGRTVLLKLFIDRSGFRRHWQREAAGLAALREAGIATPRILAQVENRKGRAALLITEYLAEAQTLADLPPDAPDWPVATAAAVALLGRMHQAGLAQHDIHPGNFLWADGAVYAIDGDAVAVRRAPLAAGLALDNLALFLAQFPPAQQQRIPLAEYLAHGRFAAQRLAERVRQLRDERWRAYRKKLLRDCTEIRCTSRWRSFLAVRREADDPALREVLAEPDRYIAEGELLKDGNSSTVALVRLPGRSLVIKRYNIKHWRHWLSRCWRPSRAWHSWINAHQLRWLGIATPQPLALLERRWGPLRGSAYFIAEYLEGETLDRLWTRKSPKEALQTAVLQLLQALWEARLAHGDLKASNLLCRDGQVALLDLDAMAWLPSGWRFQSAYGKDRERFLRNWPERGKLRQWFDSRLPLPGHTAAAEEGRRLLFISKPAGDASTRYRCQQYFPDWLAAGWQPLRMDGEGGLLDKCRLLLAARRSDAVIVSRKLFPPFFVRLLRWASRELVFDFDDALFCYSDGRPSSTRRKRFAAMVSACDRVFAGNAYLAAEAAQYCSQVERVPTSVDAVRYSLATPEQVEGRLDLVWIGSRSTRRYLEDLLPILEQAAEAIPGLRLKIVSNFTLYSEHLSILAVPWSEAGEAEALAASHIGIAPMWDDAWTRGKCALKVLQYMAAGLPVISSDVGANAEVVEQEGSGLLVPNTAAAWLEALQRLAGDAELRRRMGRRGRSIVQEQYDKAVVFRCMADALAAAAEQP
jgi:glycosyltransferase involved in cell wall biosynthesis